MILYFNLFLWIWVLFDFYIWWNDICFHIIRRSMIRCHCHLFFLFLCEGEDRDVWLMVRLLLYKGMKMHELIHYQYFYFGYFYKYFMLIIEEYIIIFVFLTCLLCLCSFFTNVVSYFHICIRIRTCECIPTS